MRGKKAGGASGQDGGTGYGRVWNECMPFGFTRGTVPGALDGCALMGFTQERKLFGLLLNFQSFFFSIFVKILYLESH